LIRGLYDFNNFFISFFIFISDMFCYFFEIKQFKYDTYFISISVGHKDEIKIQNKIYTKKSHHQTY